MVAHCGDRLGQYPVCSGCGVMSCLVTLISTVSSDADQHSVPAGRMALPLQTGSMIAQSRIHSSDCTVIACIMH